MESSAPDLRKHVAMALDEVRIVEMSPAIRGKLQGRARWWGVFAGLLLLTCIYLGQSAVLGSLLDLAERASPKARLIIHALDLIAVIFAFAIPMLFARISLRRELRFRDLYGKWRWEK